MHNMTIRDAAKQQKINLWQIADAIGITDSNFSRKLRHELPPEEQEKILAVIRQLAGEEAVTHA